MLVVITIIIDTSFISLGNVNFSLHAHVIFNKANLWNTVIFPHHQPSHRDTISVCFFFLFRSSSSFHLSFTLAVRCFASFAHSFRSRKWRIEFEIFTIATLCVVRALCMSIEFISEYWMVYNMENAAIVLLNPFR